MELGTLNWVGIKVITTRTRLLKGKEEAFPLQAYGAQRVLGG
jgi:hypothetical protein